MQIFNSFVRGSYQKSASLLQYMFVENIVIMYKQNPFCYIMILEIVLEIN